MAGLEPTVAAVGPSGGTWELGLLVTDLQVERSIRVRGEEHIGGVMIKLVDVLDIAMDWSDHALWWPAKNTWLHNTRWTLDQYNINADDVLHFTPMHKTLRVQLPDLRFTDCRVNFSVKSFTAMVTLCRELGIRHPEELSFCKPLGKGWPTVTPPSQNSVILILQLRGSPYIHSCLRT